MKKLLQILARPLGYDFHKINVNSKSISAINNLIKKYKLNDIVIFDVGAHEGQSIREFKKSFQEVKIYAFEPFPASYNKLLSFSSDQVKVFPIGLADKEKKIEFFSNKGSATNSLLRLSDSAKSVWGNIDALSASASVLCQFSTLDDFVFENGINRIDVLKIDVQGAEFRVIEGGQKTLSSGIVKIVKCEIIHAETYVGQWPLPCYLERFDQLGFDLFNTCDCVYEYDGSLLQADFVFFFRDL